MHAKEPLDTQISDRRRHQRRSTQSQVRLTVDTREVDGSLENVSG